MHPEVPHPLRNPTELQSALLEERRMQKISVDEAACSLNPRDFRSTKVDQGSIRGGVVLLMFLLTKVLAIDVHPGRAVVKT